MCFQVIQGYCQLLISSVKTRQLFFSSAAKGDLNRGLEWLTHVCLPKC